MKMTTGFVLAANEVEEYVFLNESDRNEMALSIYQEDICNRFNLEVNWYGSYYKEMLDFYTHEQMLQRLMSKVHVETMEDIFTYETKIVADIWLHYESHNTIIRKD